MEKLWPVLKSRSSSDVTICLAPMVRAGSLALRSLCLDYGASLVWSEEIIDQKLSRSERVVNTALDTIDYVVDNRTILFRTHESEKGRIILQLGTNSAATALKAAQLVQDDVAGIDINMGCPKTFSIQANMGAALLKESRHEVACGIIRALKQNLRPGLPVTAKIRLLDAVEQMGGEKEDDHEGDTKGKKKSRKDKKKANKEHRPGHRKEVADEVKENGTSATATTAGMDDATSLSLSISRTIDFLKKLQSAGVDAVSIHLRLRGDAQTEPARTWETMKMLVEGVPDLPLICNGDMYSLSIAKEMCDRSGCKGVMIGRPLLLNTSLIRPEGILPLQEVMRAFIRKCIQYDVIYQVVKYTLMEMMVLRRHPPVVLNALVAQDRSFWADKVTKGPVTMSPYWELVTKSKSLRHVCEAYGMLDEYNSTYVSSENLTSSKMANKGAASNADQKKRKLEDTMEHPARFDDAYFAQDLKEGAIGSSISVKVQDGKVGFVHPDIAAFSFTNNASTTIRLANTADIDDIVRITNDAYVADEFFKKPEYYQRFTRQDVEEMIATPQSFFLLASVDDGKSYSGSLYLSYIVVDESPLIQIQGNFGAVAVETNMSRRGIGKSLVKGAEAFILHLQSLLSSHIYSLPKEATLGGSAVNSTLEMGVINLREDLFQWYGKQGYEKLQPMPQNDELQRICLPELNVCCILMRKQL